ncbi:hypothetical protein VDG1235_3889 [Verrucomicrobiia bacterium DG1235]|nr:hypothetical protein VDG1235_3889 [Verrucomicrobiae bacterium DG1235]
MGLVVQSHGVSVELLAPMFSNEVDELPSFVITLENRGSEGIYFLPEHVRVLSGEQAVHKYTPSELSERIQEESQREAEEYSGQQAEVFLQSDAARQDPSMALATISAAKNANRAAAVREAQEKRLRELSNLIVPVHIEPGRAVRGVLKVDANDILPDTPLRVFLTLEGESYEFVFDVGSK